MKLNPVSFNARLSVMAVRGALLAMAIAPVAYAAEPVDPAVVALTVPASTVEIGVCDVTSGSYKFGEYNGLQKKGLCGIGNLDLRGGGSYDSNDATRWRLVGTDLGLETRNLSGEYGQQGVFRLKLSVDELLRNRSDTFQSPYLGVGTTNSTLPANWLKPVLSQANATSQNYRVLDPATAQSQVLVNGVATNPTAAQLAANAAIASADLPDFHNVNLATKRTKVDGGISYQISPRLELTAGATHEKKTGAKPMSTVSSQVSEFSTVIADPIDQSIDQYNVSLTYTNGGDFLQAAYYLSDFKNNIQSVSWADSSDPSKSATMSSAPSNQFSQATLTGGYHFTPTTKLVVSASYGRNTQNDAFITSAQNNQLAWGVPATSLHGLVVTSDLNMKLTARPVKGLNLSANYKFANRDNQTPVNTYLFQDVNENKSGVSPFNALLGYPLTGLTSLGSNTNIYQNRAYSKKLNQVNLDADYAITHAQAIKAGLDYQRIDRHCTDSWINCADADRTRETTARLDWRVRFGDDVSAKVGYAVSQRRVNYNESAFLSLVPMANAIPANGATMSAYAFMQQNGLTAFGPAAGFPLTPLTGNAAIFTPNNGIIPQALYGSRNNINEIPGLERFNMADRNRDRLRSSIDWQATDKLSLQAGLDLNKDDYINSVYGLRSAKGWTVNLDGSYALSENFTVGVFNTYENQRSGSAGDAYGSNSSATSVNGFTAISGGCFATVALKNLSAKMDPCLNWSTDMRDKVDTFGMNMKRKGLMSGKLDLSGDLIFSRARTDTDVTGGSYVNNPLAVTGAPATTPAQLYIVATPQPTVSTNSVALRMAGKYMLSANSSLRMVYTFSRLWSADYAYGGMQYGSLGGVMPTNEQAFNYTVNVVALSYLYSFR